MDKLVALAKRRGFIYPGSEIYGGLAGTYDYGPLGVLLKENVKSLWVNLFRDQRENVYGVDAAILMNAKVWEASGHVAGFADPVVTCAKCGHRFRADHLENKTKCPDCGGSLGEARQFNMMFKTQAGATEDENATVYLRPETAGGMFVNYKNVVDSLHPKLPFGLAQIGKAFRNEIAPRDFIFRLRELEQMEVEYFVNPKDWAAAFEEWRSLMHTYAKLIGLPAAKVHELEVPEGERAHYSRRTIDFEFDYPFGRKELWGLAYRTDFDLEAHEKHSGVSLKYLDEETGEKFTPHVIEPSLGIDRTILALLHHGKRIKPRARQTLRYNGPLSLCKSGLHASVDLLDALTYSPGNVICRVQCGGKIIHGDDKLVCSERKILWKLDATRTIRTLHEFNLWCTDQVLRAERKAGRKPDKCLLEAIKLKRKWLDNKSVETELDEAINKVYALADQICRRSSQPYSARLRAVHIVYLTCRKYAPVIRVLLMQEATKLTRKDLSAKLEQMLTKAAGK